MKSGYWLAGFVVLGLSVAGCEKTTTPTAETPKIHYVREAAWLGDDGVWFYPTDTALQEQTGLATVYPADTPDHVTTDGETFDQTALAAAHQTVPLPAILRVTNLENGQQILVRANDRGPSTPHRLIALTQRAAERLGITADRPAEVRVTLEDGPTAAMVEALGGGAPKLAISTAPVSDVQVEDLTTHQVMTNARASDDEQKTGFAVDQAVQDRVWHVSPALMPLWVEAGTFSQMRYAQLQRVRIGGSLQWIGGGRRAQYRVRLGPFSGAGEADAALDRVMHAGVTDARIVAAEP